MITVKRVEEIEVSNIQQEFFGKEQKG